MNNPDPERNEEDYVLLQKQKTKSQLLEEKQKAAQVYLFTSHNNSSRSSRIKIRSRVIRNVGFIRLFEL